MNALRIECRPPWLICRFNSPHRTLSWAIAGGGYHAAEAVVWRQVTGADLAPPVDPAVMLHGQLAEIGLADAVGLLTSRRVETFEQAECRRGQVEAEAVATVGLSNAVRVGSPPAGPSAAGTINLLCWVSARLTDQALVEAVSLAAEARTAAVLDSASKGPEPLPTGTGTDCIVVACPPGRNADCYSGKHTDVGSALGSVAYQAIRAGADAWHVERRVSSRSAKWG